MKNKYQFMCIKHIKFIFYPICNSIQSMTSPPRKKVWHNDWEACNANSFTTGSMQRSWTTDIYSASTKCSSIDIQIRQGDPLLRLKGNDLFYFDQLENQNLPESGDATSPSSTCAMYPKSVLFAAIRLSEKMLSVQVGQKYWSKLERCHTKAHI